MELKRILVPSDLSDNAEAVMPFAGDLARKYQGEISLVHVFERDYYATAAAAEGIVVGASEWLNGIRSQREKHLNEVAARFSAQEKVTVRSVLLDGNTIEEILRFVQDQSIDCMIVSTHGRTGLSHLLLGSIAEKLVRLSPCPVISIRPQSMVRKM
ncbi:MAG TPA: universal stress protein [Planctomycetota bacterium]|nr:universal stress protein [Planctomycetota bacterium]